MTMPAIVPSLLVLGFGVGVFVVCAGAGDDGEVLPAAVLELEVLTGVVVAEVEIPPAEPRVEVFSAELEVDVFSAGLEAEVLSAGLAVLGAGIVLVVEGVLTWTEVLHAGSAKTVPK